MCGRSGLAAVLGVAAGRWGAAASGCRVASWVYAACVLGVTGSVLDVAAAVLGCRLILAAVATLRRGRRSRPVQSIWVSTVTAPADVEP